MVRSTVTGKLTSGFTLIELLLVLVLIAMFASMVMPNTVHSVNKAKEAVLKENLRVVRKSLDDYYSDRGKYPETLEQLVSARYIRKLPKDPMMEDSGDWALVYRADGDHLGIVDIHSHSTDKSGDGSPYSTW